MKITMTATTTALMPLPHAHGLCHQGRPGTMTLARDRAGAVPGRAAEPGRGGVDPLRGGAPLRGAAPLRDGGPVRPVEPPPPAESSCRRCLESRATITPRSALARAAQCGARPSRPFASILSRVGAQRLGSNVGKRWGRRAGSLPWRRSSVLSLPRCNGNVTRPHGRCHSLPMVALARAGRAHHWLSRRRVRAARSRARPASRELAGISVVDR
jgi:hypothetical protein